MTNTRLTRILGQERVEAVELDRGFGPERFECDGVILTGKFRPETALIAASHVEIDAGSNGPAIDGYFRCSDHTYFAAGNFFRLDRIIGAASAIPTADYFDRLALDRARDAIGDAERRLAAAMVTNGLAGATATTAP